MPKLLAMSPRTTMKPGQSILIALLAALATPNVVATTPAPKTNAPSSPEPSPEPSPETLPEPSPAAPPG